jgi:hypothetical protein
MSNEANAEYSHLQVEAALCIWESLMRDYDATPFGAETEFATYWREHGTVHMRHLSIALADYCLAVYDALPGDVRDGCPYDWEIIPAILATIDWNIGPDLLPPPREAVAIATRALAQNQEGPRA